MDKMDKMDIKDLSPKELEDFLQGLGEEPYRTRQVAKWIYKKRVSTYEEMTDLPKSLRESLSHRISISGMKLVHEKVSSDGTRKYLFEFRDGNRVESVLIPEERRHTLCISSQVGCAMGCTFCLTGKVGKVRNLSASEILNQFLEVERLSSLRVTNIVFMGMGEPLDNFENTVRALKIFTNPHFFPLEKSPSQHVA